MKSFCIDKKEKPFNIFRQERNYAHNASTERTSSIFKIRRKIAEDHQRPQRQKSPYIIRRKTLNSNGNSQEIITNPFISKKNSFSQRSHLQSQIKNEISKLNYHDNNKTKINSLTKNNQFRRTLSNKIIKNKVRTADNSIQNSFDIENVCKSMSN